MPAKRKLNMFSPGDKGKRKSTNKKQEREETPVEARALAEDETKHGVILRNYYPREISDARAQSYADGILETPLSRLVAAMARCKNSASEEGGYKCVVHWFRSDLRLGDNTALSLASERARQASMAVVGLYVLSPQDLEAHVVSPAKVDFALRSLRVVKRDLEELGIPLHVEVVRHRSHVEERVLELCREWGAGELFANMEYEVDELRRDEKIVEMGAQRGVQFTVAHDLCVIPPGELVSKVLSLTPTLSHLCTKLWSGGRRKGSRSRSIPLGLRPGSSIPVRIQIALSLRLHRPRTQTRQERHTQLSSILLSLPRRNQRL